MAGTTRARPARGLDRTRSLLTLAAGPAAPYARPARAANASPARRVAPASGAESGLTARPLEAQDPGSRRGRNTGPRPGRLRRNGTRYAGYG